MNNKNITKKIFTLLCITYPVIYTYVTFIPSITYADLFMLIIMGLVIGDSLKSNCKVKGISISLVIISILMILRQILSLYNTNFQFENFLPFVRVIIYYLFVGLFAKRFFDGELGFKYYKNISVFSSVFIIIQYIVMQLFHKYIPGTIPFLKTSDDIAIFNAKMTTTLFDRPRSIFIEPAHFAMYTSIFLAMYLFKEKKVDYKILILITFGLLISGSTTGIAICIIIYFLYFLNNSSLNRKEIIKNLLIIIFLGVVVSVFIKSQSFDLFIRRTFETNLAISGRFKTYEILSNNEFDLVTKLFGVGIYKTNVFYPTIIRLFLFYGYFGLLVYFAVSFITYLKLNKIGKIILVIFFIFSFSASILFSRWIILYFPLMLSNMKSEGGKPNENTNVN